MGAGFFYIKKTALPVLTGVMIAVMIIQYLEMMQMMALLWRLLIATPQRHSPANRPPFAPRWTRKPEFVVTDWYATATTIHAVEAEVECAGAGGCASGEGVKCAAMERVEGAEFLS